MTATETRAHGQGRWSSLVIDGEQARLASERALRRPTDLPVGRRVADAVREHADRSPDKTAIVDRGQVLTYRDVVDRVGRIAAWLRRLRCVEGDVVAVAGTRSSTTVLGFLALEDIGAVYLPIDPSWPSARSATILRGSGAVRILTHSAGASEALLEAAATIGVPVSSLDEAGSGEDAGPVAHERGGHRPDAEDAPRYIIYTSGTTGVPKGAVVEHRGMMNHLWSKVVDLELTDDDVVAFSAPLTFDISVWQMLVAPLIGASVVILDDGQAAFPHKLLTVLREQEITVLELVPTVVGLLVEHLRRATSGPTPDRLRWLISTGEELHPALARSTMSVLGATGLLNAYGPTECSDDVTHQVITTDDLTRARLPVGGPIPNAVLYVLVSHPDGWRSAAVGEPGELFVGGVCVGAGYVDAPAATAAAFFVDVLDPASPTGRLYRTGDLAVVREGTLHYLGRGDRQVKVAGVRIEMDEVEAVIEQHPALIRCAVITTTIGERTDLAAFYVVRDQGIDVAALQQFLTERVPAALVPRHWTEVSHLPLTPNGKTDYATVSEWIDAGHDVPATSARV